MYQLGLLCFHVIFGLSSSFSFEIVHRFFIQNDDPNSNENAAITTTLFEALESQHVFSSKTQARLACQRGAVLICPENAAPLLDTFTYLDLLSSSIVVASSLNDEVQAGDEVYIQTRQSSNECYDVTVTRDILPPRTWSFFGKNPDEWIVYQDDFLAVVNKPENLTTIGNDRDDLQSLLGFLLSPPTSFRTENYHPRPVHRLDRATSGLVLVAKTKPAMQYLSRAFRTRSVQKTYSAIVRCLDNEEESLSKGGREISWQDIDYPIDNKPALSSWRFIAKEKEFSLLQVRPHTGRMHQIRRHLAYCLNSPIVGDSKYDFGLFKLRDKGMFLCCHRLEFPHLDSKTLNSNVIKKQLQNNAASILIKVVEKKKKKKEKGSFCRKDEEYSSSSPARLQVSIPLPSKFQELLRREDCYE